MISISPKTDSYSFVRFLIKLNLFTSGRKMTIKTFIGIGMIYNKKLVQYKHESDTWKRYLQFIQQENNYLKTRLSHVLQSDTDHEFLERAEYFQNRFIAEDDTVNMIRQDIYELDSLLQSNHQSNDVSFLKMLQKKLKKMQKDIDIVERQFSKLKTDFNQYLSETI
jgi:hypothetical protein